ncbi:hypothetical protein BBK14_11305 [Parafrankia soli]|uniref:MerR family transcriptional regulator n=1 Tax=Parafrankia soli TaxID=2599596 RepID=A0A1S1R8X4_9ACTN|nr:hypothetical protein [Parafrankia soli]OHV42201.1 hypothetical protein BBK14_11305 [Parafrankia soli]
MIRLDQAARRADVHVQTILEWIAAGSLPATWQAATSTRPATGWHMDPADVDMAALKARRRAA